jgi:hypothetical protein
MQVLSAQPALKIVQQPFPTALTFAFGSGESRQLPPAVAPDATGHQQQHPLGPERTPHFQPQPIEEQVGPLVSERPMMKPFDRVIQYTHRLRNSLRTDRLAGEHRRHPPHLACGTKSQKMGAVSRQLDRLASNFRGPAG